MRGDTGIPLPSSPPPSLPPLQAHTAAYHAIKACEGGASAQVGLVHHHITFKASGNGMLHYPARWMEGEGLAWWREGGGYAEPMVFARPA